MRTLKARKRLSALQERVGDLRLQIEKAGKFDETKHPRAKDGKFSDIGDTPRESNLPAVIPSNKLPAKMEETATDRRSFLRGMLSTISTVSRVANTAVKVIPNHGGSVRIDIPPAIRDAFRQHTGDEDWDYKSVVIWKPGGDDGWVVEYTPDDFLGALHGDGARGGAGFRTPIEAARAALNPKANVVEYSNDDYVTSGRQKADDDRNMLNTTRKTLATASELVDIRSAITAATKKGPMADGGYSSAERLTRIQGAYFMTQHIQGTNFMTHEHTHNTIVLTDSGQAFKYDGIRGPYEMKLLRNRDGW